jgi:hypothetical protein
VIFQGEISAGKITLSRSSPKSVRSPRLAPPQSVLETACAFSGQLPPEHSPELPAFSRPVIFPDDPNKGRFGSQPENNGFLLKVEFEETKRRHWGTVILTVEARRSVDIGIGDFAWFSLHPTFSPRSSKWRSADDAHSFVCKHGEGLRRGSGYLRIMLNWSAISAVSIRLPMPLNRGESDTKQAGGC